MASNAELRKAWKEGFAMVDEWKKTQKAALPRKEEAVIALDSYQVVKMYGGVLLVDYSTKRPLRRPY
ncbi:hypothetical protein Scep_008980 [Stephania cephalantha]|uniref:Uncharacterized protein n=1 Tax=Stephania cephalantha TaxID=152367 RepID=A0AAP0PDR5_9MAGN